MYKDPLVACGAASPLVRAHPSPLPDVLPHSSGFAATNSLISARHSASSSTTISTPHPASHSRPPTNVVASPITTLDMPNWRIKPLQYQQGERVVTIVVPLYVRWRPAALNAAVSACIDGSSSWTRRLRPRPRRRPSAAYSAAPIGIPPRPARLAPPGPLRGAGHVPPPVP